MLRGPSLDRHDRHVSANGRVLFDSSMDALGNRDHLSKDELAVLLAFFELLAAWETRENDGR